MFISAKAGNNNENHNHNDVGSFIVYIDGNPALIDVGVGTYTAQTFSEDRYSIWLMQSQWHNCPSINGQMQHDGAHYKSNNVSYSKTADGGMFDMDIAEAYPKEAAVKKWERIFTFNRTAETLKITEKYELTEWKKPFEVHFITILHDIDQSQKGKLILKGNNGKTSLEMQFDDTMFEVNIDKMKTSDDIKLSTYWGDHVSRVTFKAKVSNKMSGEFSTLLHKL